MTLQRTRGAFSDVRNVRVERFWSVRTIVVNADLAWLALATLTMLPGESASAPVHRIVNANHSIV
jgi:ABC-type transport system involved in cytochrome c biogenesis permease subunit